MAWLSFSKTVAAITQLSRTSGFGTIFRAKSVGSAATLSVGSKQYDQGAGQVSNYLLVAILSVPTLIIVGTGIALIVLLITSAASRLNLTQANAENRLAQSVIDTLTTDLNKSTADYSNWDEMYDNFSKPLNPQWAKENLGPYGVDAFDLAGMFVVGGDGLLKYEFSSKNGTEVHLNSKDLFQQRTYSKSAMRMWQPGMIKAIGGIVEFQGQPTVISFSPIAVNSEKRKASGATPHNVLIFVRALDRPLLKKLSSDFGLKNLQVTRYATNFVALTSPLGAPTQFSLTWTRSDAGTTFFKEAGPSVVIVGLAVALMFVVLAFGWAFIIGRIQDAHARAVVAEATNKSKGLFIANMSHELRTPLNAILGFSEFISSEMLGAISIPKYKEYAGDILASGKHLLGIVNNLLLFSKLDAKHHRAEVAPLNLMQEVSDVARVMQIEADKKNIRIHTVAISPEVIVNADQQSLRQILFNLLGNAVKFSKNETDVQVTIANGDTGKVYELQIIDKGCGIPESTLAEIGNPFVQAENPYSRQYQGTGLGLAICIGLAEQMGATIKIASTENVGTTVSLFLPTCEQRIPLHPEQLQSINDISMGGQAASNVA